MILARIDTCSVKSVLLLYHLTFFSPCPITLLIIPNLYSTILLLQLQVTKLDRGQLNRENEMPLLQSNVNSLYGYMMMYIYERLLLSQRHDCKSRAYEAEYIPCFYSV